MATTEYIAKVEADADDAKSDTGYHKDDEGSPNGIISLPSDEALKFVVKQALEKAVRAMIKTLVDVLQVFPGLLEDALGKMRHFNFEMFIPKTIGIELDEDGHRFLDGLVSDAVKIVKDEIIRQYYHLKAKSGKEVLQSFPSGEELKFVVKQALEKALRAGIKTYVDELQVFPDILEEALEELRDFDFEMFLPKITGIELDEEGHRFLAGLRSDALKIVKDEILRQYYHLKAKSGKEEHQSISAFQGQQKKELNNMSFHMEP